MLKKTNNKCHYIYKTAGFELLITNDKSSHKLGEVWQKALEYKEVHSLSQVLGFYKSKTFFGEWPVHLLLQTLFSIPTSA